jgi:predicted ArsR family transcriptional regulator
MDALQAVGDPELREALLFARRQSGAVTADEFAATQGIHRNVARARLERLAAAGLLDVGFERRTGRSGPGAGRPAKTYAASPELEAIEFPSRHYDDLVARLLEVLPARGRARAMRTAGAAFADDLAGRARLKRQRTLRAAATAVCDAVRRLGFHASVEHVDKNEAVIATSTCPLRPVVRSRHEAAEIDAGMWARLAALATGRDVDHVVCETHGCLDDGACRVRVSFRSI